MLRELPQARHAEETYIDEYRIDPGNTEIVFFVPVETNELVQTVFDYTLRDRTNRCAKVGTHQVMANKRTALPNPMPSAHISTEAYGDEPENLILDIASDSKGFFFEVTNSYTQQEPIFLSARIRILHIPPTPNPRIRLTITGLTGGQEYNGLSNGVHILSPEGYFRSPTGGSGTAVIGTNTYSFNTSTQCEIWRDRAGGVAVSGEGNLVLGVNPGKAVSSYYFYWHNGVSVQAKSLSYVGANGFAKDQVLSGSATFGGVTFTWERETTDPSGLWGQY